MAPNEREKYDQHAGQARLALGETAFAVAWEQGRTLSLEEAIAYALERKRGSPMP